MKTYRNLLAAALAACFATVAAIAAEVSPAGTWKWTSPGRGGGPGFEQTLKLDLKEGQLTGTLLGTQMGDRQIPDVAISDASFKDGVVKFSIVREFNGNKMTSKYEGKLDGDTIKGTSERTGRDGNVRKNDWEAKRAAEAAAAAKS